MAGILMQRSRPHDSACLSCWHCDRCRTSPMCSPACQRCWAWACHCSSPSCRCLALRSHGAACLITRTRCCLAGTVRHLTTGSRFSNPVLCLPNNARFRFHSRAWLTRHMCCHCTFMCSYIGLETPLAIGMCVLASCPGGTASNIVAYIAKASSAIVHRAFSVLD